MRLCIVDDSAVSRHHLAFLCRSIGHEPLVFESGTQLWQWIAINGVERTLVMLDSVMPDLSGPELCRMIRRDFPDAAAYLILVSADDEVDLLVQGLDAGADDYITKPYVAVELLARLKVGLRTIMLRQRLQQATTKSMSAERFAAVGQLAAGAAHEINNPLGFLKSNLEFLNTQLPQTLQILTTALDPTCAIDLLRQSYTPEKLSDDINDYSDILVDMLDGTKRISNIINSLQSFAKQQPHKKVEINLEELLTTLAPEGSHISLNLDDNLPFSADPYQISAMLKALIDNAIWATRDGGFISLIARSNEDALRIEVQDTGCGIQALDLSHIKDPFFTTRPIGEAMGLGLSLAEGIVRSHGGEMSVSSNTERGTCVSCDFPLSLV